jgi:hypothetical protein
MRAENADDIVNCPSCGATLIAGLRFCRRCGYRLGEGLDEYVPTQRLDPSAAAPPRTSTDPFAARQTWGAAPMQPVQPFGAPAPGERQGSASSFWAKSCAPRRGLWWLWMIIALTVVLSVAGSALKSRNGGAGGGGNTPPAANSLMAEADAFDTADGGGAMIRGLAGPGTSLEAAGLVGGDIITSFDGQPVRDAAAIRRLIAATPVGKAVEIIYVRDGGPPQKTVLTTAGREGFRGMDTLGERPGGRGVLDVDFDNGDRVRVPGTNVYGVQLDDVDRNGPADIAGLKKGDIIITFDGRPIRTAGDLRYRAGAAEPGKVLDVVVVRDGQQVTIPVKMGRQR